MSEGAAEGFGARGRKAPKPAAFPPARTAWYVVIMMALVNALDNIDRGIISLLIEPIKRDLQISDTEMSLLIGLAFSIFYGCLGLAMSRLSHTGNRNRLLSIDILVWRSTSWSERRAFSSRSS